jgi:hypothetical protein
MKLVEEEWDQSNLWLANYIQNSDQMFLLKSHSDLSYPVWVSDLSGPHRKLLKIQVFLSTFDS